MASEKLDLLLGGFDKGHYDLSGPPVAWRGHGVFPLWSAFGFDRRFNRSIFLRQQDAGPRAIDLGDDPQLRAETRAVDREHTQTLAVRQARRFPSWFGEKPEKIRRFRRGFESIPIRFLDGAIAPRFSRIRISHF
jgi:hypothetical protein